MATSRDGNSRNLNSWPAWQMGMLRNDAQWCAMMRYDALWCAMHMYQVDDHRNNLREIVSGIADDGSWVRIPQVTDLEWTPKCVANSSWLFSHVLLCFVEIFPKYPRVTVQVISDRADDGKNFGLALNWIWERVWALNPWERCPCL